MRKNRSVLLAVAVAAFLGMLAWITSVSREPTYKGVLLSAWLLRHDVPDLKPVPDMKSQGESEAQEVMYEMGTNAIPTLLHMLRRKDSDLKQRIARLVQHLTFGRMKYTAASRYNSSAAYGFEKLGTNAKGAVSALITIYEQKISDDSQAAAARALGSIGAEAKTAVPTLLRGVTHTNCFVRFYSVSAVVKIRAEPELTVPALLAALHDPATRESAAIGLARFGLDGYGKLMTTDLPQALQSQDEEVRRVAKWIQDVISFDPIKSNVEQQ